MKKIFILVLALTLILVSCAKTGGNGGSETNESSEATEKIYKRDMPDHETTVIVDPGHGFRDVGCGGEDTKIGVYESELTLDMAKALKEKLEKKGIKVILTHDGEEFISLPELIELCEEYGVDYDPKKDKWTDDDVFSPYERVIYMNCLDEMYGIDFSISIHVNANEQSEELKGFDLDYCKENEWSDQSKRICDMIKDKLTETYTHKKVYYYEDSWDESFIVTKFNSMPSCLFETGYSTNDDDAAELKNKGWRDELMQNLCDVIADTLESDVN